MGSLQSVLICMRAKDAEEEKLLAKNGQPEGGDIMSSTKTVLIALVVIVAYLLGGMVVFYLCQMNQEGEEWDWLDALYYSVVTVSTVGYGDLYPTTPLGKWFAIVYMMVGIGLVGLALGIVGGFLMARQEALLMKAVEEAGKKKEKKAAISETQFKLLGATGVLVVFLGLGVFAFYFLADDDADFSLTDAAFLTVQTVTTVGYGNYTINTHTQIFCIPFILLSTLLVAAALGTFADVFIERQQEKMANRILKADFNLEAILAMDTDGDASIDMGEFLEYMLVNMGKCSKIDIEKVKAQFRELDVDGSGSLDQEDIRIMQERLQKEKDSVQSPGNF